MSNTIKEASIFEGIVNCPVCGKNHPIDGDSNVTTPQGLELEYEGYEEDTEDLLKECPKVDLYIPKFGYYEIDCYFSHIKD